MNNQVYSKILIFLIYLSWTLNLANAAKYYQNDSLDFLHFSKVAYCQQGAIQNWNCPACGYFSGVTDITVTNVPSVHGQGYTAYDPSRKLIVAAFRGSDDIINWIHNIEANEVNYPLCSGCLVHNGFYSTYAQLKAPMIASYRKLQQKYPKATVLVTGHSLGGALAELFLPDLHAVRGVIENAYTYGTPRLGNTALANYIHGLVPQAWRVTHFKDPVPHVPPKNLVGYQYIQIPTEVFYNTKAGTGPYTVCSMPGVQEDPNCADQYNLVQADKIDDHLSYLGIYTGCDSSLEESESLMVPHSLQQQGEKDLGNLINRVINNNKIQTKFMNNIQNANQAIQ